MRREGKVNHENSENCLCLGYIPGRQGHNGVCICGLHWEHEMPIHTSTGKLVSTELVERWYRHTREEIAVFVRRQEERRALEQARLDRMRITIKPRLVLEKA
jgi:hypothetical protein